MHIQNPPNLLLAENPHKRLHTKFDRVAMHSGIGLYETYAAGQRKLDVYRVTSSWEENNKAGMVTTLKSPQRHCLGPNVTSWIQLFILESCAGAILV